MKFFKKKSMQAYYKMHSVTQFFTMFLGDYALMLAHLCVRSYRPKHLPIPVTNLVYTPGYDHICCFYLISKFVFK